ncbi:MAG: 3'-5' exonuclease [Dehalococcoidia bacterium]|nr:3'-5' exonuclease [Dehalococcoidia bacterium]
MPSRRPRRLQDTWFREYGRYMSEHLVAHLSSFILDYAAERRREGTLEFHDLLVLARDLLANPDNGTVRSALHQRFTHILIDEFQDTDPLQVELATRIAREPATPAETPWHASQVPPGSVFVVGDPRQSIYRFRRADIALYSRARDALGADHVTLSQNFRSRPGIIAWVNEAFSQLLAAAPDPVTTVPYTYLEHSREHAAPAPVMHIGSKVEGNASAWRRQQGDDIARTISWIRDHGHAHGIIRDDESGEPVRLSDIAILFRTRTGVASLEQALEEAGIPYRVESRSLIYQTQEIADLANILAALADPTNEVAIVAALRSPAFACTDRDLLDFRRAGGHWSYFADPPAGLESAHPVVAGLHWLADAHARAASLPVNEAVELVVRERRMMELAYAFRRPREHWQRYRYVLDQARAFAAEPGASLRRFVAWILRQQDENTSVLESAAPQSDDEAVRLMTVHAAKGLEFPVVIMTGLGTGAKNSTPTVVWDHDGQWHVRLQSGDRWLGCDGYEGASVAEKQAAAAEEARILYVAATRARELLVLALHRNNDNSNAGRLAAFAGDASCPPVPLEELGDAPAGPPADGQAAPGDAWLEERDRWIARRQQRIAESAYGNAIAATRVARGVPPGRGSARGWRLRGAPWKRGRAGTSLGRAVHAALQVVDFDDPASLGRGRAFAGHRRGHRRPRGRGRSHRPCRPGLDRSRGGARRTSLARDLRQHAARGPPARRLHRPALRTRRRPRCGRLQDGRPAHRRRDRRRGRALPPPACGLRPGALRPARPAHHRMPLRLRQRATPHGRARHR